MMMMLGEQFLLLLLPLLVFTSILTLALAQSTWFEDPLPIRYVTTPFGGLVLVEGVQMSSDNASMTFQNSSKCHCRSACLVYPACNAFSLLPKNGGTLECQITTGDLMSLSYVDNAANTTIFGYKEAALQCKVKGLMTDGFLYCVSNAKNSSQYSDEWCRRIPGFRQSISKTKLELEVLLSISDKTSGPLSVILKNKSGNLFWANAAEMGVGGFQYDGTVQSSRQYFVLEASGKRFVGVDTTRNTHYLCQASNFLP
ncbi:uncharacterized protein [Palaemon carinicauda]|uniref:uncharacterized protein n=1 Tax=Palaemon carinicauda TaxID=392227 RepID=UPI0035B59078